jgi:hypothetical protein
MRLLLLLLLLFRDGDIKEGVVPTLFIPPPTDFIFIYSNFIYFFFLRFKSNIWCRRRRCFLFNTQRDAQEVAVVCRPKVNDGRGRARISLSLLFCYSIGFFSSVCVCRRERACHGKLLLLFPPLGKNRVVENKIKKREGRTNINERETKTSEERKRVGTQTSKRLNKQMKAVLQTGWKKKRE